jgi:hypothetical protein
LVRIKEKEYHEILTDQYNSGREHADQKWTEAIDIRIAELEKQVGIPELRRLREKVRYRWKD